MLGFVTDMGAKKGYSHIFGGYFMCWTYGHGDTMPLRKSRSHCENGFFAAVWR